MSLQIPQAATTGSDLPAVTEKGSLLGYKMSEDSCVPSSVEEEEEDGEKEKEREKLPPILTSSNTAAGGFERGDKSQFSTFSSFISTINQKKEASESSNSPTQLVIPNIKNVRDLPPLCLDVRQKHRISIDTVPPELKAPVPPEPSLPIRNKTLKDFHEDMEKAKSSGDWKTVHGFYLTTFDSFLELNAAFKKDVSLPFNTIEDSGINAKFVNTVYDALLNTPQDIQKCVLKGIINGLLQEWKGPRTKDDLRAYCILLQNPQFSNTSTYVIYAHLLRQIATLAEVDHHFLAHWFKKISQKRFKQLVDRLLQFISLRLFPAKPEEFPPMIKCTWWIPSATKVLALFNAANTLANPAVIPYTDFYNSTLDHIDLMEEYHNWQCYGNSHRFSFCQYPFVISIAAKKVIIQRDSEQQMINMARQSLVDKVSRRQRPDMNMLFLNVKVRRMHLVSDSLDELTWKRADLKKKLKVTFVGEAGLDMGGLTKEWFLLLIRQIFHPDYGMFTYHKDSHCHWFSSYKCDNYSEFRLVGALMGLAVYNSITLDIRFPPCCYKKLLSPPIVPCDQNTPVGNSNVTLEDLCQIMPELAHGLSELLSYEDNVEEDFYSTFQVFQEEFGVIKSYNLKPGGDKIPVTNQNRKEYVQLYVDFILNKSIYKQFAEFYYGFHSVCDSYALMYERGHWTGWARALRHTKNSFSYVWLVNLSHKLSIILITIFRFRNAFPQVSLGGIVGRICLPLQCGVHVYCWNHGYISLIQFFAIIKALSNCAPQSFVFSGCG
nr:probable E3 ubiquitin-protein ligase HECTD2 isoform X2 [Pelodiscus sinensis]|eukprot:XP_006117511.1 probable E3 ubiquitin-protein ligase HECTD2 isoform X2 [Pelodiscus sinensis]